jgi:hypothetical protein
VRAAEAIAFGGRPIGNMNAHAVARTLLALQVLPGL